MDIDLSDSPEQSSLSFSSTLLQYSPRRLIVSNKPNPFGEDLSLQEVFPALQSPPQGSATDQSGVISKIATISASIAGYIIGGKEELEMQIKSRGKQKVTSSVDAEMDPRREKCPQRTRFPSRCPTEARRFGELRISSLVLALMYYFSAMLHRILELSNAALVTGTITTKRLLTLLFGRSNNANLVQRYILSRTRTIYDTISCRSLCG
jgi:hypothetical protein